MKQEKANQVPSSAASSHGLGGLGGDCGGMWGDVGGLTAVGIPVCHCSACDVLTVQGMREKA